MPKPTIPNWEPAGATELVEELRNMQLELEPLEPTVQEMACLHNNTNSPFLLLPAEIRGRIFSHLFEALTLSLQPCKSRRKPRRISSRNVLLTSKQCYHEAKSRLFAVATFDICHFSDSRNPDYCFTTLLANASLVRRVTITQWPLPNFVSIIDQPPSLTLIQFPCMEIGRSSATDRTDGVRLTPQAIEDLKNDHSRLCGDVNGPPCFTFL